MMWKIGISGCSATGWHVSGNILSGAADRKKWLETKGDLAEVV